MTAKEAVYKLKAAFTMCEWRDAYGDPIDSDSYYEALDMAISALEAQEEQRWVPVTKRLPEKKEGIYLCTAKWKDEDEYTTEELEWGRVVSEDAKALFKDRIFDGWAFGEQWFDSIDNVMKVTAWCKLPEPYDGGDSDEED